MEIESFIHGPIKKKTNLTLQIIEIKTSKLFQEVPPTLFIMLKEFKYKKPKSSLL